jgi:hypothetical protein
LSAKASVEHDESNSEAKPTTKPRQEQLAKHIDQKMEVGDLIQKMEDFLSSPISGDPDTAGLKLVEAME